MKSKFNKNWNSSVQPRKQIKFRTNAPLHILRKLMGAHLDKPLRRKYERRSIPLRKGDEVKIMVGKFRGKAGKVGTIDIKNQRIQIDGVQRTKKGGEKLVTWFDPSNLKIIVLDESDSRRFKKVSQKNSSSEKKEEIKPLTEKGGVKKDASKKK